METKDKKGTNAQGVEKTTERTISVTRKMVEELGEKPKMASVVSRLIEQSDAGTTGKTIFTMARMLYKQTEEENKIEEK